MVENVEAATRAVLAKLGRCLVPVRVPGAQVKREDDRGNSAAKIRKTTSAARVTAIRP